VRVSHAWNFIRKL